MKRILFFVLFLVFSINSFGQSTGRNFDFTEYGVRIEPDQRLIVVLASLEAAGIETPLTSLGNDFRRTLNADLADLDPVLREKIKNFIVQYKRRHAKTNDAEVIAPFISMAYSLTPVPELIEPLRAEDLPGELLDVLDYTPLVREFYRKANFGEKIDKYTRIYQEAGDKMRPSGSLMIAKLLDYLHTRPSLTSIDRVKTSSQPAQKNRRTLESTEDRKRERRFFIVPELLTAKGTINFVNVGDDYHAIVPPDTDLATSEVRRAYLQFVLDPIVLSSSADIVAHRDGIRALLDTRRKLNENISPDLVLAVSRSVVAAVDARQIEYEKSRIATFQARERIAQIEAEDVELRKQAGFDQQKRDALKREIVAKLNEYYSSISDDTALVLSEAYESGAVAAFHFADKLKGMEDSGFDITESIRNMIIRLDPSKESGRLELAADARGRALAEKEKRRSAAASAVVVIENPITRKLLAIDQIITNKKFDDARSLLIELLNETSVNREGSEEKSRVYYSIGRLESLAAEEATEADSRNYHLIKAKNAFDDVLNFQTSNTDKAMISLTYVAVARIYEFNEQNEYAIKVYEAAMKIGDIAGGAYKEAAAARERLIKNQ